MTDLKGIPLADGLTYDDVLLLPQHSKVLPKDTQLTTKPNQQVAASMPAYFSRNGHCNRN